MEKNSEYPQSMAECLKHLNIVHLLQINSQHVEEVLIDMLQNLLALQPMSSIILEISVQLLDYKLQSGSNNSVIIPFWVFVMRIVSPENPSLG